MDPVTLAIGGVGLATSIFGGMGAAHDASQISADEQQKFGLEQQVNEQRRIQMNLSARRQQLEDFRNTQRARAMGIAAAVSQGAQYGSGAAAGAGAVKSQGLYAAQGVSQNLQIGNNIFGLDNQISGINSQEAALKGNMATNQQWASLGGSIMSNAGTLGKTATYLGGQASNAVSSLNWLSGGPTGFLG